MTQIEILPAAQMSVRIVEAQPAYLGFALQYEYARAGRPKLYGGTQTQIWRTICWDGYAGREGVKHYETLAAARAAARRVIRNNNREA
jgi:hypothetical protein